MWETVISTIQQEFADLPDAAGITRVTLTLLMALLLGGAIGYERERHGSSAGLRTHMLVTLGSAIFLLVPREAGMSIEDMSRVIQGLVTGIGFLGAGTIVKQDRSRKVHGLTTAASIWSAAAVGMTVGLGREATAVLATVLVLIVLSGLPRLEARLSARRRTKAVTKDEE